MKFSPVSPRLHLVIGVMITVMNVYCSLEHLRTT